MNFPRFWALTKILFQSHVFNWFWRPRARRSEVRTRVLSSVAPGYFKRYLHAAAAVREEEVIRDDRRDKIFTIWQQGEQAAPELVKACFRAIRKNCKQELVVLDDNNLFDYIDLPKIIVDKYKKGRIRRAHFADICRVELLYRYGGYWMDATDFAVGPIPKSIEDLDFFVYLVGDHVGQKYMYMQNCFIRARRGAYLLAAWRAMILEYWIHEPKSFDYFMHQMLFQTLVENDPRAKKYFAEMPHVDQYLTHILWHAYKYRPFDRKKFEELTAGVFFQKISYNDAVKRGTYADAMTQMYK
ncbi:MAG: capsular polysaccharide synthesis protein [Rickettsiales bacterium]|nr:capsular polysaccharide synthesis protein [Rickettsiales bacterium]